MIDNDDLGRLLELEKLHSQWPWSSNELSQHFGYWLSGGLAAELDGELAGYLFFTNDDHHISILNIVVPPTYRRTGIATSLINSLKATLSFETRSTLEVELDEHLLELQLFFRATGFTAFNTYHGASARHEGSDIYVMRYNKSPVT